MLKLHKSEHDRRGRKEGRRTNGPGQRPVFNSVFEEDEEEKVKLPPQILQIIF